MWSLYMDKCSEKTGRGEWDSCRGDSYFRHRTQQVHLSFQLSFSLPLHSFLKT